ncbi:MAG: beta-propeller fold lactonase family protein [Terracidiphilus sp.]|jgi:6-phosphogluconolactonase (cycloisomerase 2 family)
MKFKKIGKAIWIGALSAAVVFGVTSCVQSYTVGYLYVTGTVTASTGNNGIITAYQIDHNTGRLTSINGMPVASGGANPVRAILTLGSRFIYVLNRGVNAAGNGNCYGTGTNACLNSNITQFSVGGNGILSPQQTFYTQGINPFRLFADSSGNYLYVLDHDAPDNASPSSTDNCALALGKTVTTCGDITVFKIDQSTGRLSLLVNAQVTAANGQPITYFPVPANPVDFVLAGSNILTLAGTSSATSYPYTGGSLVFPYTYSSSSGQLTLAQNSSQPLGIAKGTAIVNTGGVLYVLDNESITIKFNGNSITSPSQILPYTLGSGGALQAEPSGVVPDDSTLGNPIYVLQENNGKFVYVANQGNNTSGPNPESGIAGYFLTTSPAYQLSYIAGEPFGSGSGPQCIVEDPSNQFIYEANQYDSTVTGRVLEPGSGNLDPLRVISTYTLQGPPTWCLMDGRTG